MSDVRGRARTESLPRSAYGSIGEYVDALEGRRAIRRVLIANNGISAVKCIRSIRRWAYQTFGNEREVRGRERAWAGRRGGAARVRRGGSRFATRVGEGGARGRQGARAAPRAWGGPWAGPLSREGTHLAIIRRTTRAGGARVAERGARGE